MVAGLWEIPCVLRYGKCASEDCLSLSFKVDEPLVVHVNGNTIGRRPLDGALSVIPHTDITAYVIHTFRRGEQQAVNAVLCHLRAYSQQSVIEFGLGERNLRLWLEIKVHLVAISHVQVSLGFIGYPLYLKCT